MSLDWTAIRLLRRTLAAYGACDTYRDCGRLKVHSNTTRPEGRELFFTIDFVRPDHLRFDVGGLGCKETDCLDVATVIWDGQTAKAVLGERQAELPNVASALAWATRADGPAVSYLVRLLFGDRFPHADEPKARYHGCHEWEGFPCHRLEVPSAHGHSSYDLWIDEETHWLRGLHEHRDHRRHGSSTGYAPTRTTFEFHPALDVPVDHSVFGQGRGPSRLHRYLERA